MRVPTTSAHVIPTGSAPTPHAPPTCATCPSWRPRTAHAPSLVIPLCHAAWRHRRRCHRHYLYFPAHISPRSPANGPIQVTALLSARGHRRRAVPPHRLPGVLSMSQLLSRGLLQSQATGFAPTAAKRLRELPVTGSLRSLPGPIGTSPRTLRAPVTSPTHPPTPMAAMQCH
jgi:hypothetical protein